MFRKFNHVSLPTGLPKMTPLQRYLVLLLASSVSFNILLFMLQGDDLLPDDSEENCKQGTIKFCGNEICEIVNGTVIFRGNNSFTDANKDALLAGADPDKKAFLTIGLPTFERKGVNYLYTTLDSLLLNVSKSIENYIKIVIFLADTKPRKKLELLKQLENKYGRYLEQGSIQVIQIPAKAYPPLRGLPRTFGDSQERMYWRSKQAIDFAFLMQYCQHFSPYYLQLEDDVIAIPNYDLHIRNFVIEMEGSYWFNLDFSNMGFIGKFYRSETLENQARFFRLFYAEMPVDWLLYTYRSLLGNDGSRNTYYKNIFEHIGHKSSSLGT